MKPVIHAIAFCLLIFTAHAEKNAPYALRTWETDDGLPHNVVNTLVLRRDGFLWAATQNGLARFDGLQFTKVRSPLLADARTSSIRTVIEEDARTLLIGNDTSGLVRVTDGAIAVHPLAARIGAGQKVAWLFREEDGVFWVAFYDRALWRCGRDSVEVFPPPAGLDLYWPVSFARTADGAVYLARGAGVERYEKGALVRVEAQATSRRPFARQARAGFRSRRRSGWAGWRRTDFAPSRTLRRGRAMRL